MTQALLLQLRKGISLVEAPDGQVTVQSARGQAPLTRFTPGLLAALRTLASEGATEDALGDLVLETDGPSALASLYYHLQWFGKRGLLCYTVAGAGQPIVTLVPMTPGFQPRPRLVGVETRYRLSRFAYLCREGDALVLKSPLSPAWAILHGRIGAALIAELAKRRACADLCAVIHDLADEAAQAFLSLLASADLVAEVGEDGTLPEDNDPTLVQWEFHDLLFHARSRRGGHDYPFGATFRFLGQIPPLPAVKPRMSNEVIPLCKPDLDRLAQEDLPFTYVLETRQSIRDHGDAPITARQLGEFLYRVARVRQLVEPDLMRGAPYQASRRPYPSGGACYDLELYVTVNTCADLPSAIYHYDPLHHQLCKLAERNAHVEALLHEAKRAAPFLGEPQVLITLASRFQRLSWKYNAMAYATTLKNVGVLYQTMYLVATAMGLAPCALGGGTSALFAEAVGTDYLAESSVGEFLLGSAPAAVAAAAGVDPPRPLASTGQ